MRFREEETGFLHTS